MGNCFSSDDKESKVIYSSRRDIKSRDTLYKILSEKPNNKPDYDLLS